MILTENPDIEVVQIQFNYVDYEDPAIQSKACYEVCRKHNKSVIVMEPVKGSNLVNLPKEAKAVYDKLGTMSYASYALRFAVGFDGMMMVLSGMSDMNQMKDNLSFMKDFQPLSLKEQEAVKQVTEIFSIRSTFRFHIKFLRLVNHLPVLLALFHFFHLQQVSFR